MTASPQVHPFSFFLPTRIEFGEGASQRLSAHCAADGFRSVFLVIDPGLEASGALAPTTDALRAAGLEVTVWTDLQSNPVDVDVERATEAMRDSKADVIIGIGGGSAQDTAKGVAILAANGGRVRDYAGQDRVAQRAWPFYLVPTTAGTGSEVTANASITQSDTLDKLAIRDANAYAYRAILDPALLAGLPAGAASAAGIDALTHAIESYTSTRATDMTRCIALEAISRIASAIEEFVADRSHPGASAQMLYASCLAGIAISHTGTGCAHAVSRALGGKFGVAHGVGCGVALSHVMRFNSRDAAELLGCVASAMGVAAAGATALENAERAAVEVDRIRESVGLPRRLDIHVDAAELSELSQWVVDNAGPNPRKTSHADAAALLADVVSTA